MQNTESKMLAKLISHTLQLPWYRRTLRFAARPYIDVYSKMDEANDLLLQLAKLDFNIVQSALQQDLVQVLRYVWFFAYQAICIPLCNVMLSNYMLLGGGRI